MIDIKIYHNNINNYPELKDALPRFEEDTVNHKMQVITDDGTTRLIKFSQKSSFCGIYVTTWPYHLAYSGDMGSFMFGGSCKDMLKLFADSNYDMKYIGQKVLAGHHKDCEIEEYTYHFAWCVLAVTAIAKELTK